MPRQTGTTTRAEGRETKNGTGTTIQMSAHVRSEQDMIITMVSRMRGVDKSAVVSEALDNYIATLPETVTAGLVAISRALSAQPELEVVK